MNWNCPHCNHNMVLSSLNHQVRYNDLVIENSDGGKRLYNIFYVCSNEDCKKVSLTLELQSGEILVSDRFSNSLNEGLVVEKKWDLIPESKAKNFPDYIPQGILEDYKESCLIKSLSPKASATLSRRCLQGIIRDFYGISKGRLVDEINALENEIDPLIYKAIDGTRKIGNIGAHMEKDINLIIDVEEDEAEKLINLIEILLKECYITRYEREQNLKDIVGISEEKTSAKKAK